MKKLISLVLALVMLMGMSAVALAAGAAPDWTDYDALVAQIKAETDFTKREALMHQAEDILMETGALMPIYYYNDIFMKKADVEGFYANVYGTKFFKFAQKGDSDLLRIHLASEPDKLDPALNTTVDGASLAVSAFGGLYSYDAEGTPVPEFATGYEVSDDGLIYTFPIREGLVWSDGTKLDANDFVYSWKRLVNPETAADYSYMASGVALDDNGELKVSASEDGLTFTVELSAPCAYMLDLAAFPAFFAVNQACVEGAAGFKDESGAVINAGAWALEPGFVSSGPFMLKEWNHNVSMTYVKNPNYWNAENVKINELQLMLSADDTALYAAFQANDIDFIDSVPANAIQSLLSDPEFHIVNQLGTYYACFNVKSPMFDGMTVEQAAAMRKGLSRLVDRQYIVDTVAQTGQQLANSFIPAGMLDGNGGIFKADDADYTFPVETGYFSLEPDVDAAIELLKEAGFEFDDSGMLSPSTPISFEYILNENSIHIALAECIQQDFAAVGIDMTIKVLDWNVFLNERKAGTYNGLARNGWIADFNDPINMLEMWITDSGNNDAQFGR